MTPPLYTPISKIPPAHDVLWMHIAESLLKTKEITGEKHNPVILDMWRNVVGYVPKRGDEESWCAIFVGHCLKSSGITPPATALARNYLTWGVALAEPVFGCVCVLSRTDDPNKGHVTFYKEANDRGRRFCGRGGNQLNGVCDVVYPVKRVVHAGYRWPANHPLPAGAKLLGQ